jgi:hypothetical protein
MLWQKRQDKELLSPTICCFVVESRIKEKKADHNSVKYKKKQQLKSLLFPYDIIGRSRNNLSSGIAAVKSVNVQAPDRSH